MSFVPFSTPGSLRLISSLHPLYIHCFTLRYFVSKLYKNWHKLINSEEDCEIDIHIRACMKQGVNKSTYRSIETN